MTSPTANSEFKSCHDLASSEHELSNSQNYTQGGDSCSPLLGQQNSRSSNSVLRTQPTAGILMNNQAKYNHQRERSSASLTNTLQKTHHPAYQHELGSSLNHNLSQSQQHPPNFTSSGRVTPTYLQNSTHSINYFDKPEFENRLCGCCQNCGLCLVGLFCYPIPLGLSAVASKLFKSRCSATIAGCLCPCLMLCGIRENTRKMYKVNGTVVGDFCASCCCCCCLNCQLARELGLYD